MPDINRITKVHSKNQKLTLSYSHHQNVYLMDPRQSVENVNLNFTARYYDIIRLPWVLDIGAVTSRMTDHIVNPAVSYIHKLP